MSPTLLFPDPLPLDERLGGKFFRRAPDRTGVYLMKDADDRVLYVGKAVDLKRRLNNYRVANPDRMPRRHLRMVRQVARIEFQFCANELPRCGVNRNSCVRSSRVSIALASGPANRASSFGVSLMVDLNWA